MNNDNVVDFTGINHADLEPDVVLEGAKERLSEVLVIGWTDDDISSVYVGSSTSKIAELVLLLEVAKIALLDQILGE